MQLLFFKYVGDGKASLEEVKQNQTEFKSDLNVIEKRRYNKATKKAHCVTMKCFTKQQAGFLEFLVIILQICLSLNLKQLAELAENN